MLLAAAVLLALVARGSSPSPAQAAPVDPADLSITKSDSPDPIAEDAQLTYTIRVTNEGPDPAINVVVTDDLPSELDFVSATSTAGSCDNQGNKVTCNLGDLANAATATVTIKATVKKSAKTQISNTASVTSDTADPQTNNNSDTETTKVTKVTGPECANKKATILGTPGNDVLTGTPGNDVIRTFAGNDTVFALDGNDRVCTNLGADTVSGGGKGDLVKGGGGPDLIKGRGGGDELRGNRGSDRLRGNRGPDLLVGGRGFDSCRGGPGNDTRRSCP
jgi:uncharacterized repeat protein (TIGR01451 family)